MAEMDDWENQMTETTTLPDTNNTTATDSKKQEVVTESEDYIKPVYVKKVEDKPKGPDVNDVDYKWNNKNKEKEEKRRADEKALEGLDERTARIKREEKNALDDALEFMGGNRESKKNVNSSITGTAIPKDVIPLKIEKDFIDLAVSNVSRIKDAKLPTKFSVTYLKQNLDLLGPTLDSEKIDYLIKGLTVMFNQKRKEENEKAGKQKKIKYVQKAGKIQDQISSLTETYDNNYNEDEDDYDDDAFM